MREFDHIIVDKTGLLCKNCNTQDTRALSRMQLEEWQDLFEEFTKKHKKCKIKKSKKTKNVKARTSNKKA